LSGRTGGGMQFGGGGGGGAPRNFNAPGTGLFDSPWAPFQPEAVRGGQPYVPPFTGNNITWGTTPGASPRDLWSPQGPELGLWGDQGPLLGGAGQIETDYWNDWFDWNPGAGTVGGVGAGVGFNDAPPQYPDFPEWDF